MTAVAKCAMLDHVQARSEPRSQGARARRPAHALRVGVVAPCIAVMGLAGCRGLPCPTTEHHHIEHHAGLVVQPRYHDDERERGMSGWLVRGEIIEAYEQLAPAHGAALSLEIVTQVFVNGEPVRCGQQRWGLAFAADGFDGEGMAARFDAAPTDDASCGTSSSVSLAPGGQGDVVVSLRPGPADAPAAWLALAREHRFHWRFHAPPNEREAELVLERAEDSDRRRLAWSVERTPDESTIELADPLPFTADDRLGLELGAGGGGVERVDHSSCK